MSPGMSVGTDQVCLDIRPAADKPVLAWASGPLDTVTEMVHAQYMFACEVAQRGSV